MAISYRSSTTTTGTGTSLSLSHPTGATSGDLLVAIIATVTHQPNSVPTGWTLAGSFTLQAATSVYTKLDSGSEGASYSWGFSASDNYAASILAYTGAGSVRAIAQATSAAGDTSCPAGGVTATAGDMLVSGISASTNASFMSFTPPTGMTERLDFHSDSLALTVADLLLASSGATGTRTFTAGVQTFADYFTFALEPAGTAVTKDVTSAGSVSRTVTKSVSSSAAAARTGTGSVTSSASLSRQPHADVGTAASLAFPSTDVTSAAAISVVFVTSVTTAASMGLVATADLATEASTSLVPTASVATAAATGITGHSPRMNGGSVSVDGLGGGSLFRV